jgi:putative membrane-bound dehydrogenase-like protein
MRCFAKVLGSLPLVWMASISQAEGPAPAAEATQRFALPEGFSATLFAGEPHVVQPIAFSFDDRGRLWVVENHSYPGWKSEGRDRVLILEDSDGDGCFDRRTVFWEHGSNLSGIEWGYGGVWLCSTPNLVFVPDTDGDDRPDGQALIKLDGWDPTARHNVSSSLAWGPDGWLYGCNGILSNSKVGKPGTPDDQRTAINCGVWRYHPRSERFEVVAHGTTNPWGLDFDELGQTFITNCVIEHLWHAAPGARFQRMFGQDFGPHSYALMNSCVDHIHWAGGPWQEARGGDRHDAQGGGHAHVGAMIYLGDNWPHEYRGRLFTCNIHGNRINQDLLERRGSGYIAHHGPDLMLAGDSWFRGMTVKYGPDGGVYVSDWSDTGECHNYEVVDRTNGRIYKITYGKPAPWKLHLPTCSDEELVRLQWHENDWVVRHARRLIAERHTAGPWSAAAEKTLLEMLSQAATPEKRLRAVWALHAVDALDEALLRRLMGDEHEVVRGWAVRLALDAEAASPEVQTALQKLAQDPASAWVRMALAGGLQRLAPGARRDTAFALTRHAEDAEDRNLSLMYWYAIEPLVATDTPWAIELARGTPNPLLRELIARRLAEPADSERLAAIVGLLGNADEPLATATLVGMHSALQGRRQVEMPAGWQLLYQRLEKSAVPEIRKRAMLLALVFGDQQATALLRTLAADSQAERDARVQAIEALTQAKTSDLAPLLHQLLDSEAVRVAALRALAAIDHQGTPSAILARYGRLDAASRQEALATLAARARSAIALLGAIEDATVPRGDVSAYHIQQLQSLKNDLLQQRLASVWGTARPTAADRATLVARFKEQLSPDRIAQADLGHGRAVFAKACAVCHTLFDAGGKIGPELTGSQRANLDYVLSNVLDPSAVVARDYQMTLVQTADGRVLSGIIKREDDFSLEVQSATELVVVPKNEVESRQTTVNSMMPEGLLLSLSATEVRDLVAYLASPRQVPLPKP